MSSKPTEHRTLGRTGVWVSKLYLGDDVRPWGNPDHEESICAIHRVLHAGINVVDAADIYSQGDSTEPQSIH